MSINYPILYSLFLKSLNSFLYLLRDFWLWEGNGLWDKVQWTFTLKSFPQLVIHCIHNLWEGSISTYTFILIQNRDRAPWSRNLKIYSHRTSLVAQWLRTYLPMQGTRVWALVREDPTCCGATKPVCYNYWACALEPVSHHYWVPVPQLLKPAHLELVLHNKRSHRNQKPAHRNEE